MKRLLAVVAVSVTVVCAAGPDFLRPKTRPGYSPGIPVQDYQFGNTSAKTGSISKLGVLVLTAEDLGQVPSTPRVRDPFQAGVRFKVYQLPIGDLQVDHCRISNVGITLHENGRWILSLRADQNPAMRVGPGTDPLLRPQPEMFLQSDMLKRNQFFVKLRCYNFADPEADLQVLSSGKPVLVPINPEPFWVQRAEPFHYWTTGLDMDLRRFFDRIDRVEIEFYYR